MPAEPPRHPAAVPMLALLVVVAVAVPMLALLLVVAVAVPMLALALLAVVVVVVVVVAPWAHRQAAVHTVHTRRGAGSASATRTWYALVCVSRDSLLLTTGPSFVRPSLCALACTRLLVRTCLYAE